MLCDAYIYITLLPANCDYDAFHLRKLVLSLSVRQQLAPLITPQIG